MSLAVHQPHPDSPCVKICVIDDATELCVGCRRTIEEIMAWPRATAEEKSAILAAIEARRPPPSV